MKARLHAGTSARKKDFKQARQAATTLARKKAKSH
jgi:hypothetical protein